MELNNIKTKDISWGAAATTLNENFSKINADVEKVKSATTRNKGYFASESALNSAYGTASEGDFAYVGTSQGYRVYNWDGSSWVNSGFEPKEEVNLGDYYNKEQIDAMVKLTVYDGGRSDTIFGGAQVIDCGTANQ